MPPLFLGRIDAAVWNADEIIEKSIPLRMVPLRNPNAKELVPKCTEAVIVIQKETGIGNLLKHIIDPKEIRAIQEKVASGLMPPSF
ncbi:MAG: YhfZ family protein [Bacillota bacterium]